MVLAFIAVSLQQPEAFRDRNTFSQLLGFHSGKVIIRIASSKADTAMTTVISLQALACPTDGQ